jgi:hypothetical protein
MSPELLISTNVSEIHTEWSDVVTYEIGDTVLRGDLGIYESVVAGNLNNIPETSLTSWLRIAPTNKMAMFDEQISTSTVGTSDVTVVVQTGSIDSLALLNVLGSTVTLTIRSSEDGPIIYGPVSKSLEGVTLLDWYDYFYLEEETRRTSAIFLNLPTGFTSAHATVQVTGAIVSIGAFIFGRITTLGKTEYGLTAGIMDFSTKETDEYGNTIFTVREFSKRLTVDIQVDNIYLNKVQRTLFSLRAKPALWIGSDDARYEETTIIYGFYRDFSTNIPYPSVSRCSIEIEGLI